MTDAPKPGTVTELAQRRGRARAQPAQDNVAVRLAKARGALKPYCPIEPVGHNGNTYAVIDAEHQLRLATPRELGHGRFLFSLAGDSKWLAAQYPRFRRGKPVAGFAAESLADDLMRGCHLMGFWQPDGQVRGRGAWRGEDGALILHRGDYLLAGRTMLATGRHGNFVYPKRQRLMDLGAADQPGGQRSAGADLRARLETFLWGRGTLDVELMLGWIGAALVGGALDFRPHIFVGGEFASGKSTLQILLQCTFGQDGVISVSDTTPAGLWQSFGCDCLPVGIDELEAESDPTRQRDLIRLIRQASSGGRVLRGGASHQGAAFTIQSCFACSAILMPPMPSQDASRFHVFDLLVPATGHTLRPFATDRLAQIGAALARRMAEQFSRLAGEVIPLYRAELLRLGFPRRTADLYAALFAAADVAVYDETDAGRLHKWVGTAPMQAILAHVLAEQTPEYRRCLDYALSSRVEPRRGDSPQIGELIDAVAKAMLGTLPLKEKDETGRDHARLAAIGLKLVRLDENQHGHTPPLGLLVANQHQGLAEIFRETPWQTAANAAGGGGWAQALRRMPGVESWPQPVRFRAGVQARAIMVPLAQLWQPSDAPAAAPAGDADAGDSAERWMH